MFEHLKVLWRRLREDWRDLLKLLRGEEDEPISLAEMLKTTLPRVPEERIDWFVWECEQYAKSPVFWFDHWRYDGTPWAYPDPTEAQRRSVWNASLKRAIDQYGEKAVKRHGIALGAAIAGTPREDEYFRQPDPWAWAMRQPVP